MKKNIIVIICMIISINVFAQEAKDKHLAKLPAVEIQDLNGNPFNTKDIQNDGKPVIIIQMMTMMFFFIFLWFYCLLRFWNKGF